MAERVLVIGATGNIGVSAVKGALRSGRQVLAIVRNQASADKLYKHVGTSEGITVVEADVTSDTGVKSVVDQVKAGKLPAFQHVYTCGQLLFSQVKASTCVLLIEILFFSGWRIRQCCSQRHYH